MIDARCIIPSVFLETSISPELGRSDFDRQSFQFTWLSSCLLFSSIREYLSLVQAQSNWPSLGSFNKGIESTQLLVGVSGTSSCLYNQFG